MHTSGSRSGNRLTSSKSWKQESPRTERSRGLFWVENIHVAMSIVARYVWCSLERFRIVLNSLHIIALVVVCRSVASSVEHVFSVSADSFIRGIRSKMDSPRPGDSAVGLAVYDANLVQIAGCLVDCCGYFASILFRHPGPPPLHAPLLPWHCEPHNFYLLLVAPRHCLG